MGLRDAGKRAGYLAKRFGNDAQNCAGKFANYFLSFFPQYRQAISERDDAIRSRREAEQVADESGARAEQTGMMYEKVLAESDTKIQRVVQATTEKIDRQYQLSLQMRLAENKKLEGQLAGATKRRAGLEGIIGLQRGVIIDYQESYLGFAVSMLKNSVMRKVPVAVVNIRNGEVLYQTPYLRKKVGDLKRIPGEINCSTPDKQQATFNEHVYHVYSFPIVAEGSMNVDYSLVFVYKSRFNDVQAARIIENARRILTEANEKLKERERRFLGEGGLGINPQTGS